MRRRARTTRNISCGDSRSLYVRRVFRPGPGPHLQMRPTYIDAARGNARWGGPLLLGSRIPVNSAAGRRPAEKQPRPIGEHEVPADRLVRPVLGLIGVDDELGSDRDGLLGHT